ISFGVAMATGTQTPALVRTGRPQYGRALSWPSARITLISRATGMRRDLQASELSRSVRPSRRHQAKATACSRLPWGVTPRAKLSPLWDIALPPVRLGWRVATHDVFYPSHRRPPELGPSTQTSFGR